MTSNVDDQTACVIWDCAVTYQHSTSSTKARHYVMEHAADVIKDPSFLKLGRNLLQEMLVTDALLAKEEEIFEACLVWAKANCPKKEDEITGAAIRDTLKDCLYLIRFPLMNGSKFVDMTQSCPDVLTKEEENSVLKFFITGNLEETFKFSKKPRKWKEITAPVPPVQVARYGSVRAETWACSDGNKDAVSFTCDKAIVMKGVTVYGSPDPSIHKLQVEILEGGGAKPRSLYNKGTDSFKSTGTSDCLTFLFDKDITVTPAKKYTIVQRMWGRDVYRGLEGQATVTAGDVTFTFSGSALSQNGTNVKYGQMPGFLFQLQ